MTNALCGTYKVAAVQAAPAFLDLEAGIDKAIDLIASAARRGARLIAFPEAWLPGYPWWIWMDSAAWGRQFIRRHVEQSLAVGSPQWQRLGDAARRHGLFVAMGHVERVGGTLYLAQTLLDDHGRPRARRRKLHLAPVERAAFGEGDGSHLQVLDTPLGRLGMLSGAEHLQPLGKHAMHAQHEQVHVAAWPGCSVYRGKAHQLGAQAALAASQVYALEGGCYVLAPCATVSAAMVDLLCDSAGQRQLLLEGGGAAQIFGPDGEPLCEPLPETGEGLLIAEVDLGHISVAKAAHDPAGHSARPDVLRLLVNRQPAVPVQTFAAAPFDSA